jgi:GT2 family glycosyltransferase
VVNWNGGEHIVRCLDSLFAHPPSVSFEVIVVDNNSIDGSADQIAASVTMPGRQGCLSVIRQRENVGFARANNLAFRTSGSALVLLLNPDTTVNAGAIDTLVRTLHEHPQAGVAGAKLLNENGTTQASVWRNPPSALHLLFGTRLQRLLPTRIRGEWLLGSHWSHDRLRRVPMVSAAAMLVRRRVIDVTGGFDERFHMYGEDNDWCARITRAGFTVMFQPAAVIVHLDGESSRQRWTAVERRRLKLEALLGVRRRYCTRIQIASYDALACSILLVAKAAAWLRGRDSTLLDVDLSAYAGDLKRVMAAYE